MKKAFFKILGVFAFVLLIAAVGNFFFAHKWVSGTNPQSFQISEFKELPENSLDLLVLGSCQVYNSVSPAVIWENSHLTSYVLASPDQRIYTAYYYLKYALETQKPDYLLLDALFLVGSNAQSDAYDTKAMDSLPLTKVKLEFSNDIFDYFYKGSRKSPQYLADKLKNTVYTIFPYLKYKRSDFSLEDFQTFYRKENRWSFLGGIPVFDVMDLSTLNDFLSHPISRESIDPTADYYFQKLLELCREENIQVEVIKTVSPEYWNYARYCSVKDYCEKMGVPYTDYNPDYESYGFDLSQHFYAGYKQNAKGMEITSRLLADLVTSRPDFIPSNYDPATEELYDSVLARYRERSEDANWDEYPKKEGWDEEPEGSLEWSMEDFWLNIWLEEKGVPESRRRAILKTYEVLFRWKAWVETGDGDMLREWDIMPE